MPSFSDALHSVAEMRGLPEASSRAEKVHGSVIERVDSDLRIDIDNFFSIPAPRYSCPYRSTMNFFD